MKLCLALCGALLMSQPVMAGGSRAGGSQPVMAGTYEIGREGLTYGCSLQGIRQASHHLEKDYDVTLIVNNDGNPNLSWVGQQFKGRSGLLIVCSDTKKPLLTSKELGVSRISLLSLFTTGGKQVSVHYVLGDLKK